MRKVFAVFAALAVAACAAPDSRVSYVDGAPNAEDLVPIPGTDWLIAGGLDEAGKVAGRLTLIDRAARRASLLFSADSPVFAEAPDSALRGDAGCPGPLRPGMFGAHGIALRPTGAGKGILYAINHTGREAVELFAIDWSAGRPTAVWTGCVPLPPGVLSNSVAPLPAGRLAVTWMNAPEYFARPAGRENSREWVPKFIAGDTTGYVATWKAGEGWRKVPGTEGSVPNGIESSPDGRQIFVAIWREGEVRRIDLESGQVARTRLDFMPDNLRWGDDGRLWMAGAVGEAKAYFACAAASDCENDFAVASLDPATMKATRLPHPDTRPHFGDATAAVKVGDAVWIGSNPANRVAVLRLAP